jgi:hypothetical protein
MMALHYAGELMTQQASGGPAGLLLTFQQGNASKALIITTYLFTS